MCYQEEIKHLAVLLLVTRAENVRQFFRKMTPKSNCTGINNDSNKTASSFTQHKHCIDTPILILIQQASYVLQVKVCFLGAWYL